MSNSDENKSNIAKELEKLHVDHEDIKQRLDVVEELIDRLDIPLATSGFHSLAARERL